MPKLVLICKPYDDLIFKVENIAWNNFVWDSIYVNEMGLHEVSNLLCSYFS